MLPPGVKITTDVLWLGTLIFAVMDAAFVSVLAWRINRATFRRFRWALSLTSLLFWSALWTWGLATFWDSIYRYVFPAWAHWLIPPVFGLLYAGISLLLRWLALRWRGNAVVNFCLLGGVWGLLTHVYAVSIGIVSKPPPLQGAAPAAAVIFAVFEFMFYWCVILSVAVMLGFGWRRMRCMFVKVA
jgi:hypothetical protein